MNGKTALDKCEYCYGGMFETRFTDTQGWTWSKERARYLEKLRFNGGADRCDEKKKGEKKKTLYL